MSLVFRGKAMRKSSGQVATSLNLIIAVFVVGSLGFVAYELSRILLAREQLQHCLELAALAGGATMASSSLSGAPAQAEGIAVATNILSMNSILGKSLAGNIVQVSSLSAMQPSTGQVSVYYEFDNPITMQPAAAGQPANVMRMYGAYAYPLFSGGFGAIGVGVWTFVAQATAGLPILDVEIVYSHDGAMDDQTPVTMVRRYWDPNPPAIAYYIPNSPAAGPQQGPISGLVCAPAFGSAVNGLPPQNLDAAGDPKVTNCPKEFSEVGTMGNTVPLRGITNTGDAPGDAPTAMGGVGLAAMTPGPGNLQDSLAMIAPPEQDLFWWVHPLASRMERYHFEQPAEAFWTTGPDWGSGTYNAWKADPTMFTDLVVNIDGNNTFGGFTYGTYKFPGIDYLTEASRGNLENNSITPSTHTDTQMSAGQPGYQQAYLCAAYQQLQPKITCEQAINGFMVKLLQSSNAHFGFVSFNQRAGVSPGDSYTAPSVSWAYKPAPTATVLLPQIPLQTTNNNYATINTLLTPPTTLPGGVAGGMFVPNSGSNLADGLQQAYNQLMGAGSRTGAYKAIVCLTDKVPDVDLKGNFYMTPATNGPALSDADAVAAKCHNAGIPIFMVALDQTGSMTPYFQTQFNDAYGTTGLVNTACDGGQLYIVPWSTPAGTATVLTGDFNNIVRQLMTLIQG